MYEGSYAEVYDLLHDGRGKDYSAEAAQVLKLVTDRKPDVTSLLDVACGTGSHLRYLAGAVPEAEGVELSQDMLAIGRAKLPDVPMYQGDMIKFDRGREYDAVTILFSSISHVLTQENMDATMQSVARHLTPGGVAVVEPFWFADKFIPGYVTGDHVVQDGQAATRVSYSVRDGDTCRIEVYCVVADAESGIRHFSDTTHVALFTQQQYELAFTRAGLSVEYVPGGLTGRGVFVGIRPADNQSEVDGIEDSYKYYASLTETLTGVDLHLGYWDGEHDKATIEQATGRLTGIMVGKLGTGAGSKVLDIGCGNGRPAVEIAKTGAEVVGIDVNEEALANAQSFAVAEGVADKVTFTHGDALQQGYPDSSFDAVLVFESTPHFKLDPLYREAARVLKPGGLLAVESVVTLVPMEDLGSRARKYWEVFRPESMDTAAVHVQIMEELGLVIEEVTDISGQTSGFYDRMIARLDEHRAGLDEQYGTDVIQEARDGISEWGSVTEIGHVIILARKPAGT